MVVFAGAGVSCVAPTSLPTWNSLQESVIRAVADRAAALCDKALIDTCVSFVLERQADPRPLPPQFVAEVIANRFPASYFSVLQCLDSDTPNEVHLSLAALAKSGRLSAIVTTNFDRAVEAAFAQSGVALARRYTEEHFVELSRGLEAIGRRGAPCQLIKLHGSAEEPKTLIDTLAQRKVGFSRAKAACVRHLLREMHWLFLGYSGVDLEGNSDYLFLRGDSETARGFTWLVREGSSPLHAVASIVDLYGSRAGFAFGNLPDWIRFLMDGMPAPPLARDGRGRPAGAGIEAHTAAWAKERGAVWSATVLSDFLVACGLNQEALDVLVSCETHVQKADQHSSGFGALCDSIGVLLAARGDDEEALTYYSRSIQITLNDPRHHVLASTTLHNLADVYVKRGAWDQAAAAYESALAIDDRFHNLRGRAATLVAIANLAASRGHLGDAASRLEHALNIFEQVGDEHGRATALNNLSQIRLAEGHADASLQLLDDALAIREFLGDAAGQASTLANKAHVLSMRGRHDEALTLLRRALALRDKLGDVLSLASLLSNMGLTYRAQRQHQRAIELFDRALAIVDRHGLATLKAGLLVNIATVRFDEGSFEETLEPLQEAATLYEELGNDRGRARALSNLGNVYGALRRWAEAEKHYKQALMLWSRSGDRLGKAETDFNIGVLYLEELKRPVAAIPHFDAAAETWGKAGSPMSQQARLAAARSRELARRQR